MNYGVGSAEGAVVDLPIFAGLSKSGRDVWNAFCQLDRLAFLVRKKPFSVEAANPAAERFFSAQPQGDAYGDENLHCLAVAGLTPASVDSLRQAVQMNSPQEVVVWTNGQGFGGGAHGQVVTVINLGGGEADDFAILFIAGPAAHTFSYGARLALDSCFPELLIGYHQPAWLVNVSGKCIFRNSAAEKIYPYLPANLSAGWGDVPPWPGYWQEMAARVRESGVVVGLLDLGKHGAWRLCHMFHEGAESDVLLCIAIGNSSEVVVDQSMALVEGVVAARERERAAIAREIHDSLGQELTVLRLSIDRLRRDLGREHSFSTEQVSRFDDVVKQVDGVMQSSRRIAVNLRQDQIRVYGLAKSANELVVDYCRRFVLQGQLEIGESWVEPESGLAQNLYRMLQELLTNIHKHAKARKFMVRLYFVGAEYVLEVTDDGIGIPQYVVERPTLSIGMRSIRERADLYGGSVVISSRPDVDGTKVTIKLPERRRSRFLSEGEIAGIANG